MTYDRTTLSERREDAYDAVRDVHPSARPSDDSSLIHALLEGLTAAQGNQEDSLSRLHDDSFLASASDDALTRITEDRYGIERKPARKANGVLKFTRDTQPSSPITIAEGTVAETTGSDVVQFETNSDVTMNTDETSVTVNATAVNGGTQGNVGPNTIVSMPSPPSNSLTVTNPETFGDPSNTLTDGSTPLSRGFDRETDEELRNRALDANAFGGAASVGAVSTAIESLDDVISVSANQNATTTDNTGSGGLPEYSTEYIVYGGKTSSIVTEMARVMTAIDFQRTYGGVSGVKETYDVYSDVFEQNLTGEITRPTRVDVDLTIDIVVTDAYAGDKTVKSEVVSYIGGFDVDSTRITGLGISEDVLVDEIESRVTDVSGVRGISNLVVDGDADGNHDGTDDRTTNTNGLEVLAISNTEVATCSGADGSITINKTQI